MDALDDRRKPLSEWAKWRGEIKVNRFLPVGKALEWEDSLWCASEADEKKLRELIAADEKRTEEGVRRER